MEMPAAGKLTVEMISEMVGPDVVMPVLDVGPQEEVAMSLSACDFAHLLLPSLLPFRSRFADCLLNFGLYSWVDYWNDPSRSRRLNVTSLEITGTELANLTRTAACVRELDWIDNVWPAELKEISMARLCGATSKFGVGDSTVDKVDPTDLTSMCNVDPCGAYKKKTKWAAPTPLSAAAAAADTAEEAASFLEAGTEEQQGSDEDPFLEAAGPAGSAASSGSSGSSGFRVGGGLDSASDSSESESDESPPAKRVTRGAEQEAAATAGTSSSKSLRLRGRGGEERKDNRRYAVALFCSEWSPYF